MSRLDTVLLAGEVARRHDGEYLVRLRVARDHQPRSAAAGVMHVFVKAPLGIAAQVDVIEPQLIARGVARLRPPRRGIAQECELVDWSCSAMGTSDQHGRIVLNGGSVWRPGLFRRSCNRA